MARRPHNVFKSLNRDGWVAVAQDGLEATNSGHRITLVCYKFGDHDPEVETTERLNTKYNDGVGSFLRHYVGGKVGSYPGVKPDAGVDYSDQPRKVRMTCHAWDIYHAAEHARGMSVPIAIRAAQEFGSTWADKTQDDWENRVKMVGEGRARRITNAIDH